MTQDKSYFFLNRLIIITHQGSVAYDETFHAGVNIIRGQNSSGKSTISNFIFYAFGGDYNNWNAESLKCREVYAEVIINNITLTLKRYIGETSKQPMNIFWGNFESAKHTSIDWKTFSYQQTENKLSFSNILFEALNYPLVRTESDNNITMHQVLRLLYIDQDSPTQVLFRKELFDNPLIREAVAELLLGIYDDTLYDDRLSLKKLQKEVDEKKRDLNTLLKIYRTTGNEINIQAINKELENTENKINEINTQIDEIRKTANIRIAKNSLFPVDIIQDQLIKAKHEFNRMNNDITQSELDYIDSEKFIKMLKNRIKELDNSILTKEILGDLTLDYCPQCLSPLNNDKKEGHCQLCGNFISKESEKTYSNRLKQELQLQLSESQQLLSKKQQRISRLNSEQPKLKEQVVALQRNLNLNLNTVNSTRDEKIDSSFQEKGRLESQIEILSSQIKGAVLIQQLKTEIVELESKISQLQLSITLKEEEQKFKKETAMKDIERKSTQLLKKDLDRQDEFKNPHAVQIDFYDDSFSLDNNFNFSASSNILLKNTIRFAIMLSSTNVPFMRYPKFILCDNMEDKGMEKERTQNFQKVIVDWSSTINESHQIIFTTSMIAEELDNDSYCIGPKYNREHKTLRV